MPKPKGGRGHAAPYETRQVRVPEPIIIQVHELIDRYQDYIIMGGRADYPPDLLEGQPNKLDDIAKLVDRLETSIDEASKILQQALHLKANAGGAIKREIEKALGLLQ